ncbi:MAG TPA: cyclic nucleotide-binding domain-containing protein [Gaiellaceae bacterium]|nr:cyclic nucleotide-binding domain-containing protein [Gaiellaceae bacterium]
MRARHQDLKLEALKRVPLFAELGKRDLAAVGQIADDIDLAAGKELIRENEPGRQFFVLLEGEATVKRKGRKVNVLHAGDFFGEISLLSNRPTTATVTTATPVVVAVITRPSFTRVISENPAMQMKLLKAVAERLPGN